jgi:hypothetical protein
MHAVPGAQSFKVTLNSETGVFFGGAEPDPELDIFTVDAPVSMQGSETEQFPINIKDSRNGAQIDFIWDTFLFSIPVTVQ